MVNESKVNENGFESGSETETENEIGNENNIFVTLYFYFYSYFYYGGIFFLVNGCSFCCGSDAYDYLIG